MPFPALFCILHLSETVNPSPLWCHTMPIPPSRASLGLPKGYICCIFMQIWCTGVQDDKKRWNMGPKRGHQHWHIFLFSSVQKHFFSPLCRVNVFFSGLSHSARARPLGLHGVALDEARPVGPGDRERTQCHLLQGQHADPAAAAASGTQSTAAQRNKKLCVYCCCKQITFHCFSLFVQENLEKKISSNTILSLYFFLIVQDFDSGSLQTASQHPSNQHVCAPLTSGAPAASGAKPKSSVSQGLPLHLNASLKQMLQRYDVVMMATFFRCVGSALVLPAAPSNL